MKKIFLLLATAAIATNTNAQFTTVAPATFNTGTGLLDLVPGNYSTGSFVNGAAWSTVTVDFTRSFTIDYDASFTTTYGTGADGHVVVFGNNINPTTSVNGTQGADMGYYDASNSQFDNSLGIEFDIFDNGSGMNDLDSDHVMIAYDASPSNTIAGPVTIDPAGTSVAVEDGQFHHYRIVWDCERRKLNVFWNNMSTPRLSASITPSAYFTNPTNVKWGFTAARENSASRHFVKNVVIGQSDLCMSCMHATTNIDLKDCNGSVRQIVFDIHTAPISGTVVSGYVIDYGDGLTQTFTPPLSAPVHYYPSGTYTATITVVGWNRETGDCCREVITVHFYVPECNVEGEPRLSPDNSGSPYDEANSKVKVFPNPAKDEITVFMPDNQFNKIVVTNITGKVVFSKTYDEQSSAQITMKEITSGIYFIKVYDISGQENVQKVIFNKN